MTNELKITTEELYDKFSIYPLKSAIDGCPCCTSESEKLNLHTKPLRNLQAEDLEHFTGSAMLTWGDAADFKHFLPRIFDLLASGNLLTDTFIVLGKLELAKWKEWQKGEQELVKRFLLDWWNDLIQRKPEFDSEAFMEISDRLENVQLLLDKWNITFNDNSFKCLINFIYYDLNELNTYHKLFTYKNIHPDTITKINAWLIKNTDQVEQGFFRYEKSDKEFAKKISVSYDMLKVLKTETA